MTEDNIVNKRVNQIMIKENLNFSSFGDKVGFSDVVVGNIIKGRNKPSFNFIKNIIQTFNWVNSDWLITGNGSMLKENENKQSKCANCEILKLENLNLKHEIIALKDELLEVYRPKNAKKAS